MRIVVEACKKNTSYFKTYMDNKLICISPTPMLTAARILKRAGFSDLEPIEMYHKGKEENWAARTTVGEAAPWRLQDHPRYGFKWVKIDPLVPPNIEENT